MELRSWFSKIFGNDKNTTAPESATEVKILDDRKAVFTPYKGDFENDPDVLKCIDAIARNGAKMHPRHIRNFAGKMENLKDNLYSLLAKRPNEVQNAYQFYYQIISNLELYNDSFIYVQRDENLNVTGLYPLNFSEGKYYEYKGQIWLKFKFGRTKERFVAYDDCIHLTRFVGEDGLFGGSPKPIIKTLSIKHVLDEGIVNAIKTTQSIKGVIKSTKAMLKPEDVKKMRDQFVSDFVKGGDKSGIGGLDATTDFTPVKIEPTTASDSQVKSIDDKLLSYFGISDEIIQSKYTEDQWNAFYESILEPIGLQMSLEFSNKIFTSTQKYFGHEILFESNRLQYASNKTKIELLRYANNIMTVNELREVFNLAPREDGDVILQDLNHIDSNIANDYQLGNDSTDTNNTNEEGGNEDEGEGN
ncbi:MAG: phage portal protein [Bacilli bacterium]|nr:phage portal protein [Bacilli bacterium]